jgi:AraC family transcriptional regulator
MSVKPSAQNAHFARFRRVLAHVEGNLDAPLRLAELSALAAFSAFHFQRQFAAAFGLSVAKYVQLARLYAASHALAFDARLRILEVAIGSGYESHEAFARAFKKALGQTPSAFRDAPDWDAWHATFEQLMELRRAHMEHGHTFGQVEIRSVATTPIALLVHRGSPARIGEAVRQLIAFRKTHGLPPRLSATFNILYDNPNTTPPEDYCFGLAAATGSPVPDNPQGVVASEIPGGRCAVLRHVGPDATMFQAVNFLYAEWLPQSGETLRDFPPYLQRVLFQDVPPQEAVTDIFLPLR